MRIAVLVDKFPKLSETFVLNQIVGLLELGHDLRILTKMKPVERVQHRAVERLGLMARTVEVGKYRGRTDELVGACLARPRVAWQAARLSKKRRRDLGSLVGYFARHRVDLVLAHFGPNGERAARVKQLGFDWPLVTMFHGCDLRSADEESFRALFESGDRFLAISQFSAERIIGLGAPAERVVMHPVGIDCGVFRPGDNGSQRLQPRAVPRMLTVARLHTVKAHEVAIVALWQLIHELRVGPVEYRIVGDGQRSEELRMLVGHLGLERFVHFLGPLDSAGVLEEYRAADVFVLPSMAEVLPVTLMEAQAVGLPVVATDVGAVEEVVSSGQSGVLVPPGDPDALARAIARLVNAPERRECMGREGRRRVSARYDVRELNRRLDALFRSLVARSHPISRAFSWRP